MPGPLPAGEIGAAAEQQALNYLCSRGLKLRERNYRCRGGELDLVMEEGDALIFVEVRFRRSERFGGAAESIDRHKRERLWLAAQHYLQRYRLERKACRFDVVVVRPGDAIDWLKDALQQE